MAHAYNEYRCSTCHKLLCKGFLVEGEVEIKCKSCHGMTTVKAATMNEYLCGIRNCPQRVRMDYQR